MQRCFWHRFFSVYNVYHAHKKTPGGPELLENLQIELSGFAEYLVAAVIPNA